MRVSVLVAILVADIGENGTLGAVLVDIDTLVQPAFLDFETVLGVIADVDSLGFVLDGDFANFYTVDFLVRLLRVARNDV